MSRILWIAMAGAAGTLARYGVTLWATGRFGSFFPAGTLIVNIAGCFAIALMMQLAVSLAWPPTLRLAVVVGFLGGFTTYSSFNYETMRLFEGASAAPATLYVMSTLGGGWVAGMLGLAAGRLLTTALMRTG